MVIGESLVVGCDSQIQWWVGQLMMGKSVVGGLAYDWVPKDGSLVGGCVGCDGGGFCCAKSVVVGPACEWVPKYGSAVGGLAATVGVCVGWVSQWVASVMF